MAKDGDKITDKFNPIVVTVEDLICMCEKYASKSCEGCIFKENHTGCVF